MHHNAIHFFLVKACRKGYRVKLPLDIPFQLHAKDRKVAESLQQPLRQNTGYLCIVLQHDAQGVVVA
ncbi:conserved domain protein [Eggerthella sp. HGA1]|nr:conserved domain protein [Eggerthella sp. HGA1]